MLVHLLRLDFYPLYSLRFILDVLFLPGTRLIYGVWMQQWPGSATIMALRSLGSCEGKPIDETRYCTWLMQSIRSVRHWVAAVPSPTSGEMSCITVCMLERIESIPRTAAN